MTLQLMGQHSNQLSHTGQGCLFFLVSPEALVGGEWLVKAESPGPPHYTTSGAPLHATAHGVVSARLWACTRLLQASCITQGSLGPGRVT